jgi:gliding motility-associated lipoprotein GldH
MLFKKYILYFLIIISICISSCTQLQLFEKNSTIPNNKWNANFTATGSFDIKDTGSFYNIYIIIRHTDAYKYNNIWLNIGFQAPADTIFNQKREIILGTDISGWVGVGMNDIWEVRELLTPIPRKFKKTGTYHFSIQHIMRDNPLLYIMAVGLRVQKVNI